MSHPDYSQLRIWPSDLIHKHKPRGHSGGTGEAFGCCPACGEFVVIENMVEGQGADCPACRKPISRLVPLGEGG